MLRRSEEEDYFGGARQRISCKQRIAARQRIGSKPGHCATCNAQHHLLCLCNATAPVAPQWVPQWQAGWLCVRQSRCGWRKTSIRMPHTACLLCLLCLLCLFSTPVTMSLLYASHHVSSVYAALHLIDDESRCNFGESDESNTPFVGVRLHYL